MLEWKPRLVALIGVLAVIASLLGGLSLGGTSIGHYLW